MRTALKTTILASAFCVVGGLAQAQSMQNEQTTQPPATPPARPGSPTTIPEKTPSTPGTDGAANNVTDKLKDTGGVIKPPADVDPAMAKPAPSTQGTMPVIKPPEEKGGPTAK